MKKIRIQRHTRLVYGEGATEEAFLKYLNSRYGRANAKILCTVKSGNGGSPVDIIKGALTQCKRYPYDRCYIVLDADVPFSEKDVSVAGSRLRGGKGVKVEPVIIRPRICLECFFLELIEGYSPSTCEECKRIFHQRYMNEKDKYHWQKYESIFPRSFLDQKRASFVTLDAMIRAFE